MPKKRTGKALLIKPGSQSTIASSSNPSQNESTPSVNDLIRESRRLQLRDQSVSSTPQVLNSLPPQVRQVLNIPQPEPPRPRQHGPRSRPTPIASSDRAPSRYRMVPGPPPPRSWLTNSRHAPQSLQGKFQTVRVLESIASLPGGSFPPRGSLQDYALKELAVHWHWHAQNTDPGYFATVPTPFREALLSYIATFTDNVTPACNPLKLLFLEAEENREDYHEVTRLDLERSLSSWTQLKSLERALLLPAAAKTPATDTANDIVESWDEELLNFPIWQTLNSSRILKFSNLQHLSLGLNPTGNAIPPSWDSLLKLAEQLSGLRSLSLAHWPLPTYTPRAAITRATISAAGQPPVVFGGTNMYSAMDEDWVEACGILRSLSRKLPSLTWLDLSGCGSWWHALIWRQVDFDETRHAVMPPGMPSTNTPGPEWNGAWRAVTTLVLKIGWTPADPEEEANQDGGLEKDKEYVRLVKKGAHAADRRDYEDLKQRQTDIVHGVRMLRRHAHGSWLDVVA